MGLVRTLVSELHIIDLLKERRLTARNHVVKIFPASRPEWPGGPRLGVKYQAEQGVSVCVDCGIRVLTSYKANFLRTHYPDVDIASDLIREELEESSRLFSELRIFDPYAGNQLVPVMCGARTARNASFMAFPMGRTGCDLSKTLSAVPYDNVHLPRFADISPITSIKRNGTMFKPSANPIESFDTPIQQIVSCPTYSSARTETCIAVRTGGGIKLLEVHHKPNLVLGVATKELSSFTRTDTGDRRVVDLALHGGGLEAHPLTLFAVNDAGTVFKYNIHDSEAKMYGCLSRLDRFMH